MVAFLQSQACTVRETLFLAVVAFARPWVRAGFFLSRHPTIRLILVGVSPCRVTVAAIGFVRLPSGGRTGKGGTEYGLVLPLDVELSDKANLEAQL